MALYKCFDEVLVGLAQLAHSAKGIISVYKTHMNINCVMICMNIMSQCVGNFCLNNA